MILLTKKTIAQQVCYLIPQKYMKKILFNQINDYIEPYFSDLLRGFRRNHNTQHCLIKTLEKWKHILDNGYIIGVLFMDLSKALMY